MGKIPQTAPLGRVTGVKTIYVCVCILNIYIYIYIYIYIIYSSIYMDAHMQKHIKTSEK